MVLHYVGPDARLFRTILDPFTDDPNFPDLTGVETITIPAVRAGSGAPISRMMLTFVFFTDAGVRRIGGTATLQPFFVERPEAYGQPRDATGIWHPSSDALVDYNLSDPLIVTVTKHPEFGINISSIAPPNNAAELRIAIQEFT